MGWAGDTAPRGGGLSSSHRFMPPSHPKNPAAVLTEKSRTHCGEEMAGITGEDVGFEKTTTQSDGAFEWDDNTHLYFHSSSGFYHDPNAGWYYSSRDGIYYAFENGGYVPLEIEKTLENPIRMMSLKMTLHHLHGIPLDLGVETKDTCEASHDDTSKECPCADHEGMACEEIQEDQSSPRNIQDTPESSGRIHSEDNLSDEQNWLAQYGQVVPLESEGPPTFPVVDLWNWELVRQQIKKKNKKKKKKKIVSRLVGRLVNQSTKLHPSMPAGGRLLKTAHICEVHHDLVRVASGKVYKLRSPSVKYLASLSVYDSSNPTKDWGFPDFDVGKNSIESSDIDRIQGSEISDADTFCMDLPAESDQPAYILNKEKKLSYRDRAAERRSLHGGFGIGPGQKNANSIEGEESSSQSVNLEEAQAEALNMSFGSGSYARRLLEGMGWKEDHL
ncbi:hypothetical protein QJS04_geneDACA005087 [Acorus gramineus]|uniref:OCRE domain-containing protein n=1 Tax=Acorus gramineus TaxID=55184 RepID=A0AAV9AX96_ACOGR|nr:hypothetical protein QJS04_geneDACA005087 [Acorus gramineus]